MPIPSPLLPPPCGNPRSISGHRRVVASAGGHYRALPASARCAADR